MSVLRLPQGTGSDQIDSLINDIWCAADELNFYYAYYGFNDLNQKEHVLQGLAGINNTISFLEKIGRALAAVDDYIDEEDR